MKTTLMTLGFVLALGMIGGGLFWEGRKKDLRMQAEAMRAAELKYEKIMAELNAPPAPPDPREVAVEALIALRGKLASCETPSEAHAVAWAIRDYAETIRDCPPPVELSGKIPGVGIGYTGQHYLDRFGEGKGERALPDFRVEAKRLAAEIDAALMVIK